MVSGPGLLPPHPAPPPPHDIPGPPLAPPPRAVCDNSHRVTGIELVGATILVRVLVFGRWDRQCDVKPPIAAGIGIVWCHVSPDFRKLSTCAATSHLEHGISTGAGYITRFVPKQNPPPKPQGRRRRVLMQCSASAPERRLYHSNRGTIGNGKQVQTAFSSIVAILCGFTSCSAANPM